MAIKSITATVQHRERAVHIRRVVIVRPPIIERLQIDLEEPASPSTGQWIVILGENGAGKTTLLRSLAWGLASDQMDQWLMPEATRCMDACIKVVLPCSLELYSSAPLWSACRFRRHTPAATSATRPRRRQQGATFRCPAGVVGR